METEIDEFQRLVDLLYGDKQCFNCLRDLPNKGHKTSNGCKYCDSEYHKTPNSS